MCRSRACAGVRAARDHEAEEREDTEPERAGREKEEHKKAEEEEHVDPWLHKLPPSLISLQVVHARDSLLPEFAILSRIAKDEFPNLRTLIVDNELGLGFMFKNTNIDYQRSSFFQSQMIDLIWNYSCRISISSSE